MSGSILMLSDSPLGNTGFGLQTGYVAQYLHEAGWDVNVIGYNTHHRTLKGAKFLDGTGWDFKLLSGSVKVPYAQDLIMPYLRDIKPDIFYTLLDTFMCYPWGLNLDFAPAKSVFWYPSDGGWFPNNCENILRKWQNTVAMSKYGQAQVKSLFNINSQYIPHGVFTDRFYPLSKEKKEQAKMKWGVSGKFVVGCVARNQPRKMLDREVRAFAKFAEGKDDVVMLFNSDPDDNAPYFQLTELIKRWKIENKVKWTGMRYYSGLTQEDLNSIYNVMDVHFLSTSGEGFGIPIIEASSCKVPNLVTDYTTTKELITDHESGFGVPLLDQERDGRPYPAEYDGANIRNGTWTGSWEVDRGLMDMHKAVEMLEILYRDEKLRKKMGENGRTMVLREYDMKKVVLPTWLKYLNNLRYNT